jgi:DinB superfamily
MSDVRPTSPVPYSALVGTADPLALLRSTPQQIAHLVQHWQPTLWSRSYSAGKWSAAQLVLHLAHDEIGWSNRVRLALSVPSYVAVPYDGADWVRLETPTDPDTSLAAFLALRRLNLILYQRLTPLQLAQPLQHPVVGDITIAWILARMAGHDLHHFTQLQAIAALQ